MGDTPIIDALPVIAECIYKKSTAERYGHVVIKLDFETDEELIEKYNYSSNIYFYSWEVDPKKLSRDHFEYMIKEPIDKLGFLMETMNKNTVPLRFTVLDGSSMDFKPAHQTAAIQALIDLINKL